MGQKSTLNLETETQTSALRIERLELNLTIEKTFVDFEILFRKSTNQV